MCRGQESPNIILRMPSGCLWRTLEAQCYTQRSLLVLTERRWDNARPQEGRGEKRHGWHLPEIFPRWLGYCCPGRFVELMESVGVSCNSKGQPSSILNFCRVTTWGCHGMPNLGNADFIRPKKPTWMQIISGWSGQHFCYLQSNKHVQKTRALSDSESREEGQPSGTEQPQEVAD